MLVTLSTLAIAAGCDFPASDSSAPDNSSVEASTESVESTETPDDGGETPDDGGETPDDGGDDTHDKTNCTFGEWETITEVSCTQDGLFKRTCLEDETHTETLTVPARVHDYGYNGVCKCGTTPTVPNAPTSGYIEATNPASGIMLSDSNTYACEMYNRYMLDAGNYYTAELNELGEFWFEYRIPEAGQYAVIVYNAPANSSLERYDGSSFYVNPQIMEGSNINGNLISTSNCGEGYFHSDWISIGCIRGEEGAIVQFTIVKVGAPAWTASNVYVNVEAKNINGVKAPEGTQGTLATEVPYETTGIYLDETTGWYHMPTGEVIYVAISKPANRQFGGTGSTVAFTTLLSEGSAGNFRIHQGTLPSGDYLIYNYTSMFMADPESTGEIYNENSYQAQANSDGLYPLTQELRDFLVAHASKNPPASAPDEAYAENAWLSACYYYKVLQAGSEGNPYVQTTVGTFTATRYNKYAPVYYTFRHTSANSALTSCFYSITINTDGVTLILNQTTYQNKGGVLGIQNIVFESNTATGTTLCLSTDSTSLMEIEVTINYVDGSAVAPYSVDLGAQNLSCMQVLCEDGTYKYETFYAYTATADGTLTLTSANEMNLIMRTSEENTATFDEGVATLTVKAGEVVLIYVSTADGANVDVNLEFTA